MIRFLVLIALLFLAALGFHRLKSTPGEVAVTVGDTAYVVDLPTAAIVALLALAAILVVIALVRALMRAPRRFARGWRRRGEDRGRRALSEGLLAVASGEQRRAERAAQEAGRRLPELPLTRLLQAQTAQLRGDHVAARRVFQEMIEDPQTRIAGLRGLYGEAERDGEGEAARQIAARAREEAPAAPWASRALLRHQTADADWQGALDTLSRAADARILDKRTARRQRAVILTARALALEESEPERARLAALEAHELSPDLAPAAVAAGRLLSRQGDIRRAVRVLEAAWKAEPHPEIADAYLHVRSGDAAGDRLKRAEALQKLRPQADEGRLAVARAAMDARDFTRAREVLTPVLTTRPTQRALILMAELDESETGDRGRAREWLARAVHAPRDPAWTADGIVLERWAPTSPVTGRIDAVEWRVPLAELQTPLQIDASELRAPALPKPAEPPVDAELVSAGVQPHGADAHSPAPEDEHAASAEAEVEAMAPPPPPPAWGAGLTRGPQPTPRPPEPERRINGNGAARARAAEALPPPDAAELDADAAPLPPPIPDDPGVGDDEEEATSRRLRGFWYPESSESAT